MRFEDLVAFFEAQGHSMRKAFVLAMLALEAEGGQDDAP